MDFPKVSPKREWVLTKEVFDCFLARLAEDRDEAGRKYEDIRFRLIKFFQWGGSEVPDIDADETLNRVMRKIDEGADVYNLNGYIYGVARWVHAESLKQRHRKQELEEGHLVELSSMGIDGEAGRRDECLERCLGLLSKEDHDLITEYYWYEKADKIAYRKRLAARLGVSMETLRVRAYRLRLNLEACVERCLGRY